MEKTRLGQLREVWKDLDRNIYEGERYERNMRGISFVALILVFVNIVTGLLNLMNGYSLAAVASLLFLLSGLLILFLTKVKKNRSAAVWTALAAVVLIFTYEIFTVSHGFTIFWTLLLPMAFCYMVAVKPGIILSLYFLLLYCVIFFTPLRETLAVHYSDIVIQRFPLLYLVDVIITAYIMVQYHRSALFEIDYEKRLNEEVARQTAMAEERSRKIEQMSMQTIQMLAYAIDAKDPYTRGHSTRVSRYSVRMAEALGWDQERISDLRYAALLHDIGKIGVPDSILNRPKRLTQVEYDIIKTHTTMGAEILRNRTMVPIAEDVAESHHEWYDGSGYPKGKKGTEISEEARVVAIADAFDAMSSNRVYLDAYDAARVRSELLEGKGKQFDPEYTDVFVDLWDRGALDDIIRSESAGEKDGIAPYTTLLNEILAPESILEEKVDINSLVDRIQNSGNYEGAMDVEYQQFARIYEYVENLGKRFSHTYKLVMVTLDVTAGENPGPAELEKAMDSMERSIRQTIRNVDVMTRYSRQQFLIILLGTDHQDVKTPMDRIFRGYYKMNDNGAFTPSYSVADV